MRRLFIVVVVGVSFLMGPSVAAGEARPYPVEAWRAELHERWRRLPEPPITPYDGPFRGQARAFVGEQDWKHPDEGIVANWRAMHDYAHTAKNGVYDPRKDPRPINVDCEGKLDEVALYGRALSAEEVTRHFAAAAGAAGFISGPSASRG
jgi:hypothetical protein